MDKYCVSKGGAPLVSICCTTYNQENYIRDALEGFVCQKGDFSIEILIHDDASSDRTADIIGEYHRQYPEAVRPIYQCENQYSKGRKINPQFNYSRARGKYIALCEGDDYWVDPLKIAKQVQALERERECNICFHSALKAENGQSDSLQLMCNHSGVERIFTIEEVILGGGGFMPTASIVMRRDIIERVCQFFEAYPRVPIGDFYTQVLASEKGGALYLPMPACVHRTHSVGSWSSAIAIDSVVADTWAVNLIESLYWLEEYMGHRHKDAFREHAKDALQRVLKKPYVSLSAKRRVYGKHYDCLNLAQRFAWFLLLRTPLLLTGILYVRSIKMRYSS